MYKPSFKAQGTIEQPFGKRLAKKSIAQGTIEYLVVIAIVVVVGLLVVGLLNSFLSSSDSISGSSSDLKNKVGVGGISIIDAVASVDSNGLIVLKNISSETLNITKINVDGVDHNYYEQLFFGKEKPFRLKNIAACAGTKKSYTIIIYFSRAGSSSSNSADFKEIKIDCTPTVIPLGNFVDETPSSETELPNSSIPFFSSCWSDVTNPHPICNCDDLNNIRNNLDWSYVLNNDINMNVSECAVFSSGEGFEPISTFIGDFNGAGHKITNFFINKPLQDHVALFGFTNSNATIEKIGFDDVNIIGKNYVAGVSGENINSIISLVYVSGSVTGTATIIGGLVGLNSGFDALILNSYSEATVQGSFNGEDGFIGGIVGENWGTVSKSYFIANVSGDTTNYVGGIAGDSSMGGKVHDSYFSGEIAGISPIGAIVGGLYPIMLNNYWYDRLEGLDCYGGGDTNCTRIFEGDGGLGWFYSYVNGPIDSWGNWTTTDNIKYYTTDGNWSICEGLGNPWLSWEDKNC